MTSPEVNSCGNDRCQTNNTQPSQDNSCDGHALSLDAKGFAADLPQGQIAEDQRGKCAQATYPRNSANEAADREATGVARWKNQQRRICVESGIQFRVEPAVAVGTLNGVVFNL